jgi:hypothetical protein
MEGSELVERFHVSRPTIYDVLKHARLQKLTSRNSANQRFRTLQYILSTALANKVEQTIQERLKRAAKRYKQILYPGELSFTSIPSDSPY